MLIHSLPCVCRPSLFSRVRRMILGATAAVGLLPDPLFTQQDDDSSWMPWRPSTLPLFRGGNRSCLPGFLRSTTPRTWLCLHEGDLISNKIRQAGEWPDCRKSVSLWQEHIGTGSGGLLIEAGANIGACTMEVRAWLRASGYAPRPPLRHTSDPPFLLTRRLRGVAHHTPRRERARADARAHARGDPRRRAESGQPLLPHVVPARRAERAAPRRQPRRSAPHRRRQRTRHEPSLCRALGPRVQLCAWSIRP